VVLFPQIKINSIISSLLCLREEKKTIKATDEPEAKKKKADETETTMVEKVHHDYNLFYLIEILFIVIK